MRGSQPRRHRVKLRRRLRLQLAAMRLVVERELEMARRTEHFLRIIREGGSLVMHPDTLAEFKRTCPPSLSDIWLLAMIPGAGCRVFPNEYLEPGTMIAIEKRGPQPPEFKLTNTEFDRTWWMWKPHHSFSPWGFAGA